MTSTEKDRLFTAMCLWECILDDAAKPTPALPWVHAYRDSHGACETRDRIVDMVGPCEEAWKIARDTHGYDFCFDWEFVPAYLALGTGCPDPWHRTIELTKTPAEIAALVCAAEGDA